MVAWISHKWVYIAHNWDIRYILSVELKIACSLSLGHHACMSLTKIKWELFKSKRFFFNEPQLIDTKRAYKLMHLLCC